jgi:hypothetical protein
MRSIKMYAPAVVALATVALSATSASAANWDPGGVTKVAGTGSLTLKTAALSTVTCTATMTMQSFSTDTMTSTAPPVFDNCSSNIANPTTVTSSTPWTLQADSTTLVTFRGAAKAIIGGGLCVITASTTLFFNDWSNTAHTLTFVPNSFIITEHGFCDGALSAGWSGTLTYPSNTIIT